MDGLLDKMIRFGPDERGQATVEWTLLVGAFGLPMIIAFGWLLAALSEYYRMVAFLETLPFP